MDLDAVRFPGAGQSSFLHFIQGRASALEAFWSQIPQEDLVLAITYDQPLSAEAPLLNGRRIALHWPGSTWAQGRNFGRDVALRHADRLEYVAFLDDDVEFDQGDYKEFLSKIQDVKPLVAAPIVPRTNRARYINPNSSVQVGAIHDEQLLVFHKSALLDAYVWPLVRDHEDVSWHVACIIQQYFIARRFPGQMAQFNAFVVRNDGHVWDSDDDFASSYAFEADFARVRSIAFDYVSKRLGGRGSTANDLFRRVRAKGPLEALRKIYWSQFGRDLFMNPAGLKDRDGNLVALSRPELTNGLRDHGAAPMRRSA